MDEIRTEIESLDKELIRLVAKRMGLCKKLGEHKKGKNLNIVDKDREKALFAFWNDLAKDNHISPEFIQRLLSLILDESIKIQKNS